VSQWTKQAREGLVGLVSTLRCAKGKYNASLETVSTMLISQKTLADARRRGSHRLARRRGCPVAWGRYSSSSSVVRVGGVRRFSFGARWEKSRAKSLPTGVIAFARSGVVALHPSTAAPMSTSHWRVEMPGASKSTYLGRAWRLQIRLLLAQWPQSPAMEPSRCFMFGASVGASWVFASAAVLCYFFFCWFLRAAAIIKLPAKAVHSVPVCKLHECPYRWIGWLCIYVEGLSLLHLACRVQDLVMVLFMFWS